MPRVRHDWESEYTDPISEEEDRRAAELEQMQNDAILRDLAELQQEDDIWWEEYQEQSFACDPLFDYYEEDRFDF